MKILFFTNTSSNYHRGEIHRYNGGGWICSLEDEMRKINGVELGVAFWMNGQPEKVNDGKVTYYPMELKRSHSPKGIYRKMIARYKKYFVGEVDWKPYEIACLKVVEDFKPDIIEIFGSEGEWGLIADKVNIPIVLHIQGILTPCMEAFLPPFVSWSSYYCNPFNLTGIWRKWKEHVYWKVATAREHIIIKHVRYFIGRTDWDKRVITILNPQAKYIYGSEVLRPDFYINRKRFLPKRFTIITTISSAPYKGFDLVLKTAYQLKLKGIDFEWQVYGNTNPSATEHRLRIHHADVNVHLMGVVTSQKLQDAILSASVYVHPSYIDNSPNSLCEAQILGCPVVATNVGGIPSLINHGETGFLVPANDPSQMAYFILLLYGDKELNIRIGEKARETALVRHNPESIVNKLITDFENIISENNLQD